MAPKDAAAKSIDDDVIWSTIDEAVKNAPVVDGIEGDFECEEERLGVLQTQRADHVWTEGDAVTAEIERRRADDEG